MKTLIVMSATPGSGKSTWAKMYQEAHPNTFIISSDEVRKEITGTYQDFSKQKEVWELFEKRLKEFNEQSGDFTVILDALNDLNSLRQKYALMGDKFDMRILVVLRKPHDVTVKTNKERRQDKWVPDDALKALEDKFEIPDQKTIDMFDEYRLIKDYF